MLKAIAISILFLFFALLLQQFLFNGKKVTEVKDLKDHYDYIIIGGGTAGAVVAARLSENSMINVLVLEAGGEETTPYYTHIPSMAGYLAKSIYDWQYETVPQQHGCHAMANRQSYWPRGKGLGGTSILNWMIYVRGHPADFDRWAELGNLGWSYEEVLPYFNKAETTEVDEFKNSAIHGHDGPLHIINDGYSESCELLAQAAKESGIPGIKDGDGHEIGGFTWLQYFAHKAVRQSSVRSYLRPAMGRKNLHVITNAHVTKILFTNEANQIKTNGVEFQHSGKLYQVKVNKEVILAAGAVNSPQILMLSGIGTADHLHEHNITIVLDSPAVGQNLDDHLTMILEYSLNKSDTFDYETMFDYSNLIKSIPQYLLFGSGPLASPPIGMVGYFHSGLTIKHKGPDLQLYISPGSSADYRNGYLNLKPELEEHFERTPKNRSPLSLFSILLHPHSLGEIRLKSNDPFDHPLINPRYMNNDIDDKIQAEGLKIFINLMTSKTMSKYDPKLMEKPMPGCDHLKFLSDEYLACISRQRASTLFHPVGTCRMGTDKANSVVDPNLKVHGVLGLRIVDASVFPEQTSGNTAAPVIMVAEKASDLIKKDAQM